jgi:lysozyme family protein
MESKMANFDTAFEKTAAIEGGYVFDPDDAGGETYKGISRRFNPLWQGWDRIDEIKMTNSSKKEFGKIFDQDKGLQEEVVLFYKQAYWDKFWGDDIPVQEIAEELFDTGVNIGVHRAVEFLQKGLNLLNRNKKNYTDVFEDGLFGRNTLKALQAYLKIDDVSYLLKVMNVLQGMHYIEYMRKNPAQEKYARGWLKRVKV